MALEIILGTSQKPASSSELVDVLRDRPELTGRLYIGYPIVPSFDGPHPIDALLISEEKGIVIFDLIDGSNVSGYSDRQDDSANRIEARLRMQRRLTKGRDLRIPIHTISFAPGASSPRRERNLPITNRSNLLSGLAKFRWPDADESVCISAMSTIETISTIRQSRVRRATKSEHSKGAKLKRLEESISTLDNPQSRAVIETIDGVQRIRGLAGSGKTIVLALKAAYLHAQHPDWRIAVTFNTRSLKGQFRRLINAFSLEQTSLEPDWENLRVINAWGAPGGHERDGVYFEFCRAHDIEYLDYGSARHRYKMRDPFPRVCEQALKEVSHAAPRYDVILIDEAQDFSPSFLQLCHKFLKEPRRLVYAYDELQNLSGESLPSPEEIFGGTIDDSSGTIHRTETSNLSLRTSRMGLSGRTMQDIILERCYRNSRPVLVTAHALGFGIYRIPASEGSSGLIQMFDNATLWTEVGYHVKSGDLVDGSRVVLERSRDSSPEFLENHSSINDLVQFRCFDSVTEQDAWVAEEIGKNLEIDELRCDDIVVINPDPRTTRANVGNIRRRLFEMDIESHLAGVDTDPDTFFDTESDSVTFTGVFRAKGNEAGMVYIINAQDCHSTGRNLATIRNQLFTAITRSKAWIRVAGFGEGMRAIMAEFDALKNRQFELEFIYPDPVVRDQLRIVHRDMTAAERKRVESRQKNLASLVEELETGEIHVEDMDRSVLEKLREFLQ